MKYAIHPEQKISALKIIECSDAEWAETLATVGDWLNDNGQPRFEDTIPGIAERPDLRGVFSWCLPRTFIDAGYQPPRPLIAHFAWKATSVRTKCEQGLTRETDEKFYSRHHPAANPNDCAKAIRSLPETDRMIFWTDEPLEIDV